LQRYKKYLYQQTKWDKNFHFVSVFSSFVNISVLAVSLLKVLAKASVSFVAERKTP